MMFPREDMHVHSTYSDGKNSLEENVLAAERAGLQRLCCVDHVRRDTGWVPRFVEHVRRLDTMSQVSLQTGVEAKLLTESGELDLPAALGGVDLILAADHRLPFRGELLTPGEAKAGIQEGTLQGAQLTGALVRSYLGAMQRYPSRVLIAHPFSFLRQAGIALDTVTDAQLDALGAIARRSGTCFEVSERWRCPSARIVARLKAFRVEFVISTDSHRAATIGKYNWVRRTLAEAEQLS